MSKPDPKPSAGANAVNEVNPVDERGGSDGPRMGSEYTDARTFLERPPKGSSGTPRRRSGNEPQHGSNDSDFGVPDQRPE